MVSKTIYLKTIYFTRVQLLTNRYQDGKWTVSPRATNGLSTKIGVLWQKSDFLAKNWDFGPKKSSFLGTNHVLATIGKSYSKKKVAFYKINISLLTNLGCFCDKTHFWPKKHFSAKRKNGRFFVIMARTGSVVILGHFLMARTFLPNFVENGPKLRVLILVIGEWPKTGVSPKKWPIARNRRCFLGWSKWKRCSPRYTGDMPYLQKFRLPYKKLTFGPKFPNFRVKKAHFRP